MLNRCWMLFLLFLLLGLKDLKHQILGDRRTWVPTDTWAFGASTFQSKVARAATQNPSNLSPGKSPETAFFWRFFQYELDYELVVSWFILMLGSTSIDSIESIESLTSFFPCSH